MRVISPRLPATRTAPERVIAKRDPAKYERPYKARKDPIHSMMKAPSGKGRFKAAIDIRMDPVARGSPATNPLDDMVQIKITLKPLNCSEG